MITVTGSINLDIVATGPTLPRPGETVTNARFGAMPNWNTRLSEAEIRAVASYVHGLGGGEMSE